MAAIPIIALAKPLIDTIRVFLSMFCILLIMWAVETFIAEKIRNLKMTIRNIDYLLSYLGGETPNSGISNPATMWEVKDHLNRLASQLPEEASVIPFYRVWAKFGIIPPADGLNVVADKLKVIPDTIMGNSDETVINNFIQQNAKSVDEIRKLLGIAHHR
ncbi:MAG: hypothetical protein PHR28_12655 [candidate division Zixibacteria bacterium]|nr:hypothetical protein [candidate division Zixibacteria bacterium]